MLFYLYNDVFKDCTLPTALFGDGTGGSTFLRDVPIKGIQNAAVRAHFYPAPVESTPTPRIVRWILLSLSDHAPRMLRVRENGYLGGEWTGDQIKHTHAEFSKVDFPSGQLYHVWEVDEV